MGIQKKDHASFDFSEILPRLWQGGEKVLIRCQAGANRSGLITAIVLMTDGMSAEVAIAKIRAKRKFALSKSDSVKFFIGDLKLVRLI